LIESRENVICELNFSDGCVSCYGSPDGEPDDALLRERGVEDSVDTVLFHKTGSAAEYSSEFDILSEYFGAE
jgi:hypothetical protein